MVCPQSCIMSTRADLMQIHVAGAPCSGVPPRLKHVCELLTEAGLKEEEHALKSDQYHANCHWVYIPMLSYNRAD